MKKIYIVAAVISLAVGLVISAALHLLVVSPKQEREVYILFRCEFRGSIPCPALHSSQETIYIQEKGWPFNSGIKIISKASGEKVELEDIDDPQKLKPFLVTGFLANTAVFSIATAPIVFISGKRYADTRN